MAQNSLSQTIVSAVSGLRERALGKSVNIAIELVRKSLIPADGVTVDLGDDVRRWDAAYVNHIYTGDLHLKNDRGAWTIVEEEDYLSITNNKTKKRYKFVLEEIKD